MIRSLVQFSLVQDAYICMTMKMEREDVLVPSLSLKEPLELARISIDERIFLKLKNGRRLKGILHAYDRHLNMVLGDVEETVIDIDIEEDTHEEIYKESRRRIPMLFLRGEGVILMTPLDKFEGYAVKTPCAAIRAFRHGKESESAGYVAGEHTAMQFVADHKSSTVVAGGPQRRSCRPTISQTCSMVDMPDCRSVNAALDV
ncbi:hypothetical protein J437_LFUL013450 [Ladona fulva]|uniref:Sm domain-containing protein n=1 Tax=Ladona fulva TaxID=123851 RepID=A0A8K0KJ24_LADFU|nr:hypothetical protein J437_LFUL013450 [Ladona fulva]